MSCAALQEPYYDILARTVHSTRKSGVWEHKVALSPSERVILRFGGCLLEKLRDWEESYAQDIVLEVWGDGAVENELGLDAKDILLVDSGGRQFAFEPSPKRRSPSSLFTFIRVFRLRDPDSLEYNNPEYWYQLNVHLYLSLTPPPAASSVHAWPGSRGSSCPGTRTT